MVAFPLHVVGREFTVRIPPAVCGSDLLSRGVVLYTGANRPPKSERRGGRIAFDRILAERVRECLASHKRVEEKTLFGCACFLLRGNVLVGVWKDALVARVGQVEYEDALFEPHVKEFDITGRAMKGWVRIGPGGVEDDEQLNDWVRRSLRFVSKLPAQ